MKTLAKLALLIIDFLVLDQVSKYFVKTSLSQPVNLLGDFFKFEYAENTGIAFSLPVPYLVIIISNILLIGFLIYLAVKELNLSSKIAQIAIALLIAGGVGNLIDRILHGFVVDFISIWKYPFFNLADAYIITAVLLLVVFYGKIKRVKK
ncbi:MAG: signal peptidase II [Candidatus Gracilibacteria bacterium]